MICDLVSAPALTCKELGSWHLHSYNKGKSGQIKSQGFFFFFLTHHRTEVTRQMATPKCEEKGLTRDIAEICLAKEVIEIIN